MNKTTTLKTRVYKNDYDFFIEYIGEMLDAVYNPEENYGDYTTLAIKHYLQTLQKHEKNINGHIAYILGEPREIQELKPVKIKGIDVVTLEKFKTYIHDKYGILEPFLGVELSLALYYYLDEELINPPEWNGNEYVSGMEEDEEYLLEEEDYLWVEEADLK